MIMIGELLEISGKVSGKSGSCWRFLGKSLEKVERKGDHDRGGFVGAFLGESSARASEAGWTERDLSVVGGWQEPHCLVGQISAWKEASTKQHERPVVVNPQSQRRKNLWGRDEGVRALREN